MRLLQRVKKSPEWLRTERMWLYNSMKTALVRAQAEKAWSCEGTSLNNCCMASSEQGSGPCKCCQKNSAKHDTDTQWCICIVSASESQQKWDKESVSEHWDSQQTCYLSGGGLSVPLHLFTQCDKSAAEEQWGFRPHTNAQWEWHQRNSICDSISLCSSRHHLSLYKNHEWCSWNH